MCLWEICGGVCCNGDDLCPVLTGLESGPHADGEERQSGGSQAQPGGRTGQGDSYSPSRYRCIQRVSFCIHRNVFFINHFTDLLPEEFQHQVCGDDALPGLGQSRSSAENRAVQGRHSGEKSKRIKHSMVKSTHRQILCYLCFHFVEQALAFFLYFIRFD